MVFYKVISTKTKLKSTSNIETLIGLPYQAWNGFILSIFISSIEESTLRETIFEEHGVDPNRGRKRDSSLILKIRACIYLWISFSSKQQMVCIILNFYLNI